MVSQSGIDMWPTLTWTWCAALSLNGWVIFLLADRLVNFIVWLVYWMIDLFHWFYWWIGWLFLLSDGLIDWWIFFTDFIGGLIDWLTDWQLYRSHLKCILKYQFPANLSSVLSLLLQGKRPPSYHFCCNKFFVATKVHLLLRQKCACRDKTFVVRKVSLSRQKIS